MKKKAIYASLLFLILVIGFYIYNAFNGNPISRSLAEKNWRRICRKHTLVKKKASIISNTLNMLSMLPIRGKMSTYLV
ncbi:YfjL-like protein [Bacillus swezeyi]|uniref:YfjL-like protein n=1 Tax=Bacillus swezeyi TaxID=1925020 RepID=UPI003F89023E